jgi:hypothetical protein
MQHADDFGDETKSVGRDVEPEVECLGREGKRIRLFLLLGDVNGLYVQPPPS